MPIIDLDHPPEEARPYVALFEHERAQVSGLRDALARVVRERDEYQSQCHAAHEERAKMTSAAAIAAASTVSAIERIQELMLIVDAAVAWRQSFVPGVAPRANLESCQALRDQVDAHLRRVKARS